MSAPPPAKRACRPRRPPSPRSTCCPCSSPGSPDARAGRARPALDAHQQRSRPSRRVVQLGFASEIADRAGARRARRPAVREDQPARPRPRRGHEGASRARSRASTAWSRSRRPADRITVAVHDPFAPFPLEDVKRVTGSRSTGWWPRAATSRPSTRASTTSSQPEARREAAQREPPRRGRPRQPGVPVEAPTELDPAAAPVVKALDHILGYAFEQRASDIHFEPKRELTLVRLRIDGMLHDVHLIPKIVYQAVVSRIKLLSGCNLAEKRRPAGRPHQARAGRPRGRAARLAPCPPRSARRRCCASSTPTSC